MNNIVNFPSKQTVKFAVRATIVDLFTNRKQDTVTKKHALIVLQNLENKKEVVHPITDFIFENWKNKEYNSMATAAFHTVAFLNWVYFESDEPITDLSELDINNIVRFLFNLTYKGNQKSTVQKYENTLRKFCLYLYEKGIAFQDMTHSGVLNMLSSEFKGVIYHTDNSVTKIHDFKTELIIPFIETAFYERNQIALGVYYQIFGGLRSGEVVSIDKSTIQNIGAYGEFGQVVKTKTNYFRRDIVSTSGKGEAKKDREQVIFPYRGLLAKLYKHHIQNYKCDDSNALFVNRKNKAMTGDNYEYHFAVLKEKFLTKLLNSSDIRLATYGTYLKSMNWSTHIGRGLFSNTMAEYTNNVLELAVARGDSNLNSSLTYIADTKRMVEKLQGELELLYVGDFLS